MSRHTSRWRRFLAPAIVVMILLSLATSSMAAPVPERSPVFSEITQAELPVVLPAGVQEHEYFLVELSDEPAAVTYAATIKNGPEKAKAAANARRAAIEQAQKDVIKGLGRTRAQVLYQVQTVYNGIAIKADSADLDQIRKLRGVKAIHILPEHERLNASSVPLIGAPEFWNLFGTGEDIKIAVIDTGIDYLHANFGGDGSYASNDSTDGTDSPYFGGEGDKVAGGWDFVGDAYNGRNTAVADSDPMDCEYVRGGGHGSHVAGTAAGYGVNLDGTTYTGGYGSPIDASTLSIGPGVAPKATLYAYRVFGCEGSTRMTLHAIDMAVEDGVDVINMSLGSPVGVADPEYTNAIDNAVSMGIIVVASAGNEGDLHYISGSPASSTRAISVASSLDGTDIMDGFDVIAPVSVAGLKASSHSGNYNWFAMTAPVEAPVVYAGKSGCYAADYTPDMAGKIVMVDWFLPGKPTFECGSATRANRATAAGAVGLIIVGKYDYYDTAIAGNAAIPATYTTKIVGDEIKGALATETVVVRFFNDHMGNVPFYLPNRIDTVSGFSSRGPRGLDGLLKPDITAPGDGIFSVMSGTGSMGASFSGTSMAAPHMAGVMALMRQGHPDWTVEELKALVMNTARHDLFVDPASPVLYGPGRVGAGRVDVAAAMNSDVVAYNADVPGAVSVSFGILQVKDSYTATRTVRVVNKGETEVTYALDYAGRADIPGVEFTYPATVTVPAGGEETFPVTITATASAMTATYDPSLTLNNRFEAISEESGLLLFLQDGTEKLRLPLYVTARRVGDMAAQEQSFSFQGPAKAAGKVTLDGMAVSGATVSAFDLHGVSPNQGLPPYASLADLAYVGASTNALSLENPSEGMLYFGIATHGDWSTPADAVEFDIYVDKNRDQKYDVIFFNWRLPDTDVFVTYYYDLNTGAYNALTYVGGYTLFDTNVLFMAVPISWLGLTGNDSQLFYSVYAFSGYTGLVDAAGPYIFNYMKPAFSFGNTAWPIFASAPGATLDFTFDPAGYGESKAEGLLLFHHENGAGDRVQVIPVVPPKGQKK